MYGGETKMVPGWHVGQEMKIEELMNNDNPLNGSNGINIPVGFWSDIENHRLLARDMW